MSEPRLKSGLWVRATLRRWQSLGLMGVIARKGDEDAGAIIVRFRVNDGRYLVFTQAIHADQRVWIRQGAGPLDEAEVNRLAARALDIDSDLWIVEAEGTDSPPQDFLLEAIET